MMLRTSALVALSMVNSLVAKKASLFESPDSIKALKAMTRLQLLSPLARASSGNH